MDRKLWIYRGQAKSKWPLKTNLERLCLRTPGGLGRAEMTEHLLLREFKRRWHHFSSHSPEAEDTLEWFSIMAHCGAPTRLVDFTYSVYVAAYFALEKAEDSSGLWCINRRWLETEANKILSPDGECSEYIRGRKTAGQGGCFRIVVMTPRRKCVVPANPYRLNERLTIQRAAFVVPSDIHSSFMRNLLGMPGIESPENITKVILDGKVRKKGLQELYHMGISRETLFPGVDGFARTFGVYHPVVHGVDNDKRKWGRRELDLTRDP